MPITLDKKPAPRRPNKLVKRVRASGPRLSYDCGACPAYCCSIYERVAVKATDVRRLAAHYGLTIAQAKMRFTKLNGRERILRRKADPLLGETCRFLNSETRGCSIYHARPDICREYPGESRCGYFDVIQFERRTQGDKHVLPMFQVTFPGPHKRITAGSDTGHPQAAARPARPARPVAPRRPRG